MKLVKGSHYCAGCRMFYPSEDAEYVVMEAHKLDEMVICLSCITKAVKLIGLVVIERKVLEAKMNKLMRKCQILRDDKGARFGADNRESDYNEMCGQLDIYEELLGGDGE